MPFVQLKELPLREMMPGFHGRFAHGEQMTFSYWTIAKGAQLPEHQHPHEQISVLIDGAFEMSLSGETRRLHPGEIVMIPSQAPHSGKALRDCVIMDIFSPVRDEFR